MAADRDVGCRRVGKVVTACMYVNENLKMLSLLGRRVAPQVDVID